MDNKDNNLKTLKEIKKKYDRKFYRTFRYKHIHHLSSINRKWIYLQKSITLSKG